MAEQIPYFLAQNPQADWMDMLLKKGVPQAPTPDQLRISNQAKAIPPREGDTSESAFNMNSLSVQAPGLDPYWQGQQQVDRQKLKEYMAKMDNLISARGIQNDIYKSVPKGIDFTALGAFADQLNDGKTQYANAMKAIAPMNEEERIKLMSGLDRALTQDQGQLAEIQAGLLGKSMQGIDLAAQQRNANSKMHIDQRVYSEVAKPVQKISDEYQAKQGMIAKVEGTLNDPNTNANDLNMILSDLAKGLGQDSGALSNDDQKRLKSNTLENDIYSFMQYVSGKKVGQLSPATLDTLKAYVRRAKEVTTLAHKKRLQDMQDTWKHRYLQTDQALPLTEMFNEKYKKLDQANPPRPSLDSLGDL